METEYEYCKELYDMTEEFEIATALEDVQIYLGLSVTLGNLRNLVDKKIEETGKIIKQFGNQLNKDISALISSVGNIKDECMVSLTIPYRDDSFIKFLQQPWLYDINSNIAEVMEFLTDLHDRLVACQEKAAEFKNYQKQFRVRSL